ncbi:CRISPR-associated endoribonuclease Cas6 [Panacibacter ginsenosidivorans]|uniref:CRISPR-associated endoribonuclease n=1 Tax=Panacibacter ginsenosidivorans TaxID=1813871 RepID=A0A5B8VDG9_9BACT|nr:CRISPR-associated endoribonuclease Cas6 [Panacibacter ginsenosidivorans]QEC69319.1 CRISPR-associated endoribonuclease Cas6 [Panacibacter ginsenosidivorans]
MRFYLTLQATDSNSTITLNYQYPLSAAIYKIIQRADTAFSAFLHNTGYGLGHKNFKLFTFSDIDTPFKVIGDRMHMLSNTARVTICFYMPQAAEHFIRGLFMQQQLEIADKKSKATFVVQQIESLPHYVVSDIETTAIKNVLIQPLSPLVAGRKNEKGYYDYRSPLDADFTDCLLYNWLEKYKTVNDTYENTIQQIKEQTEIKVLLFSQPPKQRLITIKQGTSDETRVRGYTKFRLQLTAPEDMLQLAMDAGLGLYNSQGMGCVGVI